MAPGLHGVPFGLLGACMALLETLDTWGQELRNGEQSVSFWQGRFRGLIEMGRRS